MKTFYSFKNPEAFQSFLRTKIWKSGELDYVTVNKIIYTMHEYDLDGKTITWANKKHHKMIELTTKNRYKNGYSDAQVIEYEPFYLRTDIYYHE